MSAWMKWSSSLRWVVLRSGLAVSAASLVFLSSAVLLAQEQKTGPEDGKREGAEAQIENYLEHTFESDTETRRQPVHARLVADRVESVLADFINIGGYFRAGYGRDGKGGPLVAFGAPGAASKYRLGNEAENFGELVLSKNVYLPGVFHVSDQLRPDGTPAGPVARVQLRMNFFNPYDAHSSAGATSVGLPEAWAVIGNVISALPEAKFWAGNRFYRRHDIHVTDFFFWDMSGGGGGIEDVQLGPVKLAFAWIGLASTSGLSYLPAPDPENKAGFSKTNFDFRVYDLPLLSGHAELGLVYSQARSGLDQNGNQAKSADGFAFNFIHTIPSFLSEDGTNKFSVQYGTGAAKTFTSGFERITIGNDSFIRTDNRGSWRVRVTENFTASLHKHFSLGPVLIAQATNYGETEGRQVWLSGGVRPIVHFTQYFNLAFEGGVDWVYDEAADTRGALYKFTVAPQVALAPQFNSRPVVRAFATAARWSSDFEGQIGGQNYSTADHAWTWGMQMEAWW